MTIRIVHELLGFYLIVTLMATSLAKLRNWQTSAVGLQWEKVIPAFIAPTAIVVAAITELSLSTLLMLGVEPFLTGCATAGLFLLFGIYRLAVSVRTGSVTCTCAGVIRTESAAVSAIVGTLLASVLQVCFALIWACLSNHEPSDFEVIAVAAWSAPIVALVIGMGRHSTPSSGDDKVRSNLSDESESAKAGLGA
jgi:Methylamine utilisation protein MauE